MSRKSRVLKTLTGTMVSDMSTLEPSLVYSDSYSSNGIEIANLAEDYQRVSYYSNSVLDSGSNASITTTKALQKLTVTSYDIHQKIHRLGIDASGAVQLSDKLENGSTVSVHGVPVGTIDRSEVLDENPQYGFTITFNPGVTNAQAEAIIHALNYTNDGPGIDAGRDIDHLIINIKLTGADDTYCNVHTFLTVAPSNVTPLTLLNDVFDGGDEQDLFAATSGMFGLGDMIDGGANTDILQLMSGYGNSFFLHWLGSLKNVEIIQGTSDDDIIIVSQEQLEDVQIISGVEGVDKLLLDGANTDLSGKVITHFSAIEVMQNNATVIVDNKEMAFLVTSTWANTTLILKGNAFTKTERSWLKENGIETIIDEAEAYPPPQISNLGADTVSTEYGKTVLLDTGSDAILINGHDDPQLILVRFHTASTINDVLAIRTEETGIHLSDGTNIGSVISIGTKDIGEISFSATGFLEVSFYEEATNADAQVLIRALTYTNTSVGGEAAISHDISLMILDREGQSAEVSIGLNVFPDTGNTPPTISNLDGDSIKIKAGTIGKPLDLNADAVVADVDENISRLTVSLKTHDEDDFLGIQNSLTGIKVDGWVIKPGAKIYLGETEIGTITNETTDYLLNIAFKDGVTAAQIQELIHALIYQNNNTNGLHTGTREIAITLTDKLGASVTQEVDVVIAPPDAPEISNIDGDIIATSAGTTVFIDEGSDAVVTHGEGTEFVGLEIRVNIPSGTDHLGIDLSSGKIDLSDGMNRGSKVFVYSGGIKVEIGFLSEFTTQDILNFSLNSNATPALLQELLHSVTYRSSAAPGAGGEKIISIELADDNDRRAEVFSKIDISPAIPNGAPEVSVEPDWESPMALDNGPLVNLFGGLVFADDERDMLTVTISFDATHGDLVIPAGLEEPGFEEVAGRKIYTFTGRPGALAIIMDVLQFDAAERPLAEAGSHQVTQFTIGVTDADHATPDQAVVEVDTVVANRAPSNVALSNATVAETTGGEVGILSATDQANAAFTYELVNSAGGRFRLVTTEDPAAPGGTITKVVANGLALDYEQSRVHTITVRVSDGKGGIFEKNLTINVSDVSVERISGAAGDDIFFGGRYADTIKGNGGNDRLGGGSGNDLLSGGAGRDIFVFNTAPNISSNKDRIGDWIAKDDTIQIENAIYGALKKTGALSKDYFRLGSKALDKDDFVGYNKATGDLWYDANGNKAGGQVSFANIGKNKAFSNADIVII